MKCSFIKSYILFFVFTIFLTSCNLNSIEEQSSASKVLEISALSLYFALSKKLSEWKEIKFSNFHEDIARSNMTPKLAKAIYIQSCRFIINILILFYSFNKIKELHKNANLIKLLLAIYSLYDYIKDIKEQAVKFLEYVQELKKKSAKGELIESRKGKVSCGICLDNFYNCPKCMQPFHIKCLNQLINTSREANCPHCKIIIEAEQIRIIQRLFAEEEIAERTEMKVEKKEKCVLM